MNILYACINKRFFFLTTNLGHSDPTKLQETAQEVQRLSPDDLKKRQIEIKVRI